MITFLLIIHGLLAVALLGAITHQTASVFVPARKPAASFTARFRAVSGAPYARAIVVLYIVTMLFGSLIYPEYRTGIRVAFDEMQIWGENGAFELKEHFAAIGLAALPAYAWLWRQPLAPAYAGARAGVTALIAFIVWWNFLVGHIVNNIRGFGG
jgi:hypothetical protein